MIVTLTPNPSVDRTVFLDDIVLGSVNRSQRSWSEPSGKGVNVALALHAHGVPVRAVVTAGGSVGAQLQTDARHRRSGHCCRAHRRRDPQQHQPHPTRRLRHQDQRGGPAVEHPRNAIAYSALSRHTCAAQAGLVCAGSLPAGLPAAGMAKWSN